MKGRPLLARRHKRTSPPPPRAWEHADLPRPPIRAKAAPVRYATSGAAVRYANSYEGWTPSARYYRSRIFAVSEALASSKGELLDVGCGPGMMVRKLLDSRGSDFRITAVDRSHEMANACAHRIASATNATVIVGCAQAMPFSDESFDVVLAMGVLEYSNITAALTEISRVTRPGGLVLATMLNPTSPYRFVEWHVYKPAKRILSSLKDSSRAKFKRRGTAGSTLKTYSARRLSRIMASADLRPVDVLYYDINFLVPPLDRYFRRLTRRWQQHPSRTTGRGWKRYFGSAYMIAARKA